jgi:hypothetical protein
MFSCVFHKYLVVQNGESSKSATPLCLHFLSRESLRTTSILLNLKGARAETEVKKWRYYRH